MGKMISDSSALEQRRAHGLRKQERDKRMSTPGRKLMDFICSKGLVTGYGQWNPGMEEVEDRFNEFIAEQVATQREIADTLRKLSEEQSAELEKAREKSKCQQIALDALKVQRDELLLSLEQFHNRIAALSPQEGISDEEWNGVGSAIIAVGNIIDKYIE